MSPVFLLDYLLMMGIRTILARLKNNKRTLCDKIYYSKILAISFKLDYINFVLSDASSAEAYSYCHSNKNSYFLKTAIIIMISHQYQTYMVQFIAAYNYISKVCKYNIIENDRYTFRIEKVDKHILENII
jgi:hypothetical protein